MDMNFGGLVQVLYNGVSKNAPLGLIGCSVGADTVIGLGVAVKRRTCCSVGTQSGHASIPNVEKCCV